MVLAEITPPDYSALVDGMRNAVPVRRARKGRRGKMKAVRAAAAKPA